MEDHRSAGASVQQAMARALAFLARAQRPSGEFTTMLGSSPDLLEGVHDPSPFVTSLVVHVLADFADRPEARTLAQRGAAFLRSQCEMGGVWRYYARGQWKHVRVPPDLDDTACASWALQRCGLAPPRNRAVLLECRDERGRFRTWMVPTRLTQWRLMLQHTVGDWRAMRGLPRKPSDAQRNPRFAQPRDAVPSLNVDPVVNANVLLYLGESAETAGALQFVRASVQHGIADRFSDFYTDPLVLCYMVMRAALERVPSLRSLDGSLRDQVRARLRDDGSFGTVLSTALGAAVLAEFDPDGASTAQAIAALLKSQRSDGAWPGHALYCGPIEFWGSDELTTALALDALRRMAPRWV